MSSQELIIQIREQLQKAPVQLKVFNLLSDSKWHCREHEGKEIASAQYAGGGGIKGLKRGTKNRPGLVIETKKEYCIKCKQKTTWDKWTGEIQSANSAANIPNHLCQKILKFYSYIDVI